MSGTEQDPDAESLAVGDEPVLDITTLEIASPSTEPRADGLSLSPSLARLSPLQLLAEEPHRFDLDQAVAVASHGRDAFDLRYRSAPRFDYVWGEVLGWRPERNEFVLGTFGLLGMGGTLPRHFTATVAQENRNRSFALHAWYDMLSGRFAALHVKAGAKHRPARNPTAANTALAAVIGMGTPGLDERLSLPLSTLLYHAGNLAARSRSAERLRAMLEEEAGGTVTIEEFTGAWVRLPESEQTRMAGGGRGRGAEGQHARLGQGAGAGAAIWDPMARFVIRLGPLPRRTFEALLPGRPRHRRLVELARLFVGLDTGFALNLVLARDEVPALKLGEGGGRLGWTSWMNQPRPRTRDVKDAIFDARIGVQGAT